MSTFVFLTSLNKHYSNSNLNKISKRLKGSQQFPFELKSMIFPMSFSFLFTCREDVHGLFEFSSAPLVVVGQVHQWRVLVTLRGEHTSIDKALWCDVAGSPSGCVKEVVEVSRVVLWQVGGFEAGKVCEQNPVPAGHHHVLSFNIPMANSRFVGLVDSVEDLEGQPALLHVV